MESQLTLKEQILNLALQKQKKREQAREKPKKSDGTTY